MSDKHLGVPQEVAAWADATGWGVEDVFMPRASGRHARALALLSPAVSRVERRAHRDAAFRWAEEEERGDEPLVWGAAPLPLAGLVVGAFVGWLASQSLPLPAALVVLASAIGGMALGGWAKGAARRSRWSAWRQYDERVEASRREGRMVLVDPKGSVWRALSEAAGALAPAGLLVDKEERRRLNGLAVRAVECAARAEGAREVRRLDEVDAALEGADVLDEGDEELVAARAERVAAARGARAFLEPLGSAVGDVVAEAERLREQVSRDAARERLREVVERGSSRV